MTEAEFAAWKGRDPIPDDYAALTVDPTGYVIAVLKDEEVERIARRVVELLREGL